MSHIEKEYDDYLATLREEPYDKYLPAVNCADCEYMIYEDKPRYEIIVKAGKRIVCECCYKFIQKEHK